MSEQRPEGYDKLPRRFKDYVSCLEDQVRSLRASRPSEGETLVRIVDHAAYHRGLPEQYLPSRTHVAFRAGQGWLECSLTEYLNGTVLQVQCDWSGLAIYPSVSNVVYVTPGALSKR